MSTASNLNHSSVATNSRASVAPGPHSHAEPAYTNGHHHHHHHDANAMPSNTAKKGKQKKATDPNEASKLIAAKISQLELDAAGDKEQEAEIGGFTLSASKFAWIWFFNMEGANGHGRSYGQDAAQGIPWRIG